MPLARKRLHTYLLRIPDIEIIGECQNGREAITQINQQKPDLVFLDVQMPKTSGFQVIEAVGTEQMPIVVFVTAFDEYAVRAFEIDALDYLIKPFAENRLIEAVDRARRALVNENPGAIATQLEDLLSKFKPEPGFIQRVQVKIRERTIILQCDDIDWIQAAGKYVELHLGKACYLLRAGISELEQKLNPNEFCRIHRGTIVKIDRIRELHPLFNRDHLVRLKDGTELVLSRTYYERFILTVL
jgi:two-component system, LytTR family, response regulator